MTGKRPRTAKMPTPLQQRGQKFVDALRGEAVEPAARRYLADPRIGIALGGGSARGLVHIPYIEAIDELGLKPAVIAGCSIGALIGGGWAAGMRGRELREHSVAVLGTLRMIAGRIWNTHVGSGLFSLLRTGVPMQLDALKVVESFIPEKFPQTFEACSVPLYVVATDFQSWHQVAFNAGPLVPAIGGSIAIPTLFKPVAYANHLLVDGGVVNPLPLDQIAGPDVDLTVGIDVNGDPSTAIGRTDFRPLDVWFGSAQIMMHSLIAHTMAAYPPDIYVRPHVNQFGPHEYWRIREILEVAAAEKDRFKHILAEKIEAFIAARQRTIATDHPPGPRSGRK